MINSYGLILSTTISGTVYYMIVNKGCTHQYIDIFNDKCPNDKVHNYVRMCSNEEKQILKKYNCRDIYQDAWIGFKSYEKFCERYYAIKSIIHKALQDTPLKSPRGTWGFPKGRKKSGETALETVTREVLEELGELPFTIEIDNNNYIKEIYTGSDDKEYCNTYYKMHIPYMYLPRKYKSASQIPGRQYKVSSEIREVLWVTLNDSLNYLDGELWKLLKSS